MRDSAVRVVRTMIYEYATIELMQADLAKWTNNYHLEGRFSFRSSHVIEYDHNEIAAAKLRLKIKELRALLASIDSQTAKENNDEARDC